MIYPFVQILKKVHGLFVTTCIITLMVCIILLSTTTPCESKPEHTCWVNHEFVINTVVAGACLGWFLGVCPGVLKSLCEECEPQTSEVQIIDLLFGCDSCLTECARSRTPSLTFLVLHNLTVITSLIIMVVSSVLLHGAVQCVYGEISELDADGLPSVAYGVTNEDTCFPQYDIIQIALLIACPTYFVCGLQVSTVLFTNKHTPQKRSCCGAFIEFMGMVLGISTLTSAVFGKIIASRVMKAVSPKESSAII